MEKMKYYIFYRESDNFHDIMSDNGLKKLFGFQLKWNNYLMLGSDKVSDETYSYILLKYGDDLKNAENIFINRKPIPFVDYTPDKKRPEKFKNL
jgi:hypothetical protein